MNYEQLVGFYCYRKGNKDIFMQRLAFPEYFLSEAYLYFDPYHIKWLYNLNNYHDSPSV